MNYRGISRSKKFEVYVQATAELKRVDLTSLSKQEKIALFLNVYNALVIHAFVVQGPPNTLWKRYKVCLYVRMCTYNTILTYNYWFRLIPGLRPFTSHKINERLVLAACRNALATHPVSESLISSMMIW